MQGTHKMQFSCPLQAGSWEGENIGHVNLQFVLQVCFIPGLNQ
jgi:hypothetical protein